MRREPGERFEASPGAAGGRLGRRALRPPPAARAATEAGG